MKLHLDPGQSSKLLLLRLSCTPQWNGCWDQPEGDVVSHDHEMVMKQSREKSLHGDQAAAEQMQHKIQASKL